MTDKKYCVVQMWRGRKFYGWQTFNSEDAAKREALELLAADHAAGEYACEYVVELAALQNFSVEFRGTPKVGEMEAAANSLLEVQRRYYTANDYEEGEAQVQYIDGGETLHLVVHAQKNEVRNRRTVHHVVEALYDYIGSDGNHFYMMARKSTRTEYSPYMPAFTEADNPSSGWIAPDGAYR